MRCEKEIPTSLYPDHQPGAAIDVVCSVSFGDHAVPFLVATRDAHHSASVAVSLHFRPAIPAAEARWESPDNKPVAGIGEWQGSRPRSTEHRKWRERVRREPLHGRPQLLLAIHSRESAPPCVPGSATTDVRYRHR